MRIMRTVSLFVALIPCVHCGSGTSEPDPGPSTDVKITEPVTLASAQPRSVAPTVASAFWAPEVLGDGGRP
jgi:hypothetical protein